MSREEFVKDTVLKLRSRLVVTRDVPRMLREVEYVADMKPSENVVMSGVAMMQSNLAFFVGDTEEQR